MKRKWKDNRGETLIEVLASILVGTLSVALLFSAVMASVKMDRIAKDVDADFQESLNRAERQGVDDVAVITPEPPGTPEPAAQVTVKNNSPGGSEVKLNVVFYGDTQLLSYKLSPSLSPPPGPGTP